MLTFSLMTPSERIPVERVLGELDPSWLTAAEIDAVLEVGYLAIACDRDLRDEELDGLGRLLRELSGQNDARGLGRLAEAIERYAAYLDRDGLDGRLESCAAVLSRRKLARDLAYKIACALALVDRHLHDREFELDLALIAALELTQDEADALAHQVHALLEMPK